MWGDEPVPEQGRHPPRCCRRRCWPGAPHRARARPRPALPTGPVTPAPGPARPAAAHCGSALSSWRRGAMCRTPTTGACGPSTVRTPPPPRSRSRRPAARPAAPASRSYPGPPEGARGRRGGARRAARPGKRWLAGPSVGALRPPLPPRPRRRASPMLPSAGRRRGSPLRGRGGARPRLPPTHPAGGSRLPAAASFLPLSRSACGMCVRGAAAEPRLPSAGLEAGVGPGRGGGGVSPHSETPQRVRGKARRGERSPVPAAALSAGAGGLRAASRGQGNLGRRLFCAAEKLEMDQFIKGTGAVTETLQLSVELWWRGLITVL